MEIYVNDRDAERKISLCLLNRRTHHRFHAVDSVHVIIQSFRETENSIEKIHYGFLIYNNNDFNMDIYACEQ